MKHRGAARLLAQSRDAVGKVEQVGNVAAKQMGLHDIED